MNSTEFNIYKSRYRSAIRQVLAGSEKGRLDEAAFPAYSHPNPLINWLFWQRLHTAIKHIGRYAPYERVLDFGCGSGVMLPFLSQNSKQVIAIDLDLVPLERVKEYIPLASNVQVFGGKNTAITDLTPNALDLIIALDVLEHVHDLQSTLKDLMSWLKPGGQLVVSGPTENILYQVGRRIAGSEYSGDYHERGIAEIKRELATLGSIAHIATLYWPVPLFEIFTVKK
jgi:2-polyprenyl-3-methyl-5-hydroxy-6-metoxy-1,4-benzoquinol methylase